MPALAPVPSVVRTIFKHTLSEDIDVVNHVFFAYTGGVPSVPDATLYNTAIDGVWDANLMPARSADLVHTSTVSTFLDSATAPQVSHFGSTPGGGAGAILSANAAAVVQFKVARRYRGGHPRVYIAGLLQADLFDAQRFTTVFLAALQASWVAFRNTIVGNVYGGIGISHQCNVSYFNGFTNHTFPSGRIRPIPTPRPVPLVDPVFLAGVNAKVASQRRRTLQSL
jgi:hypothetical protein